jgi:hypothetical protein
VKLFSEWGREGEGEREREREMHHFSRFHLAKVKSFKEIIFGSYYGKEKKIGRFEMAMATNFDQGCNFVFFRRR